MLMVLVKGENYQISEHFNQSEFDCQGKGCCNKTEIDLDLVAKLEALRACVGKSIKINSGFRCPAHNELVGGKPESKHLFGQAADIAIEGLTGEQIGEYAKKVGFKRMGIASHWAHVDVGEGAAVWTYPT